jgi:hypothetical protein
VSLSATLWREHAALAQASSDTPVDAARAVDLEAMECELEFVLAATAARGS